MKRLKPKALKLLVAAGPTREPLDPVRYLSNRSTGVFGQAVIAAAKRRGHKVVLVTGPTGLPPTQGVKTIQVETALEMQAALEKEFDRADALVMTAAVADFRPARVSVQKIKRTGTSGGLKVFGIDLVENPDIVAGLAARRTRQVVMGLALETSNGLKNARAKLLEKQLDAVVLTQLKKGSAPFGKTNLSGAILLGHGKPKSFRRLSKETLAARMLGVIESLVKERTVHGFLAR